MRQVFHTFDKESLFSTIPPVGYSPDLSQHYLFKYSMYGALLLLLIITLLSITIIYILEDMG